MNYSWGSSEFGSSLKSNRQIKPSLSKSLIHMVRCFLGSRLNCNHHWHFHVYWYSTPHQVHRWKVNNTDDGFEKKQNSNSNNNNNLRHSNNNNNKEKHTRVKTLEIVKKNFYEKWKKIPNILLEICFLCFSKMFKTSVFSQVHSLHTNFFCKYFLFVQKCKGYSLFPLNICI